MGPDPIPLLERDPVGRPVDEEDDSDQLLARYRAPGAGVARLRAVVAHHEVTVRRDRPGLSEMLAVGKSALGREIVLFELHERGRAGLLDQDEALVVLVHRLPREADDALHERAAFAALESGLTRSVEDHDVAARRRAEVETDTAREDAVARVAEAAGIRLALRAVQRRLHGRRRDAVGVDDPLLEREDDQDRAGDRENPVERDADASRQAGKETGERVAAVPRGIAFRCGVVGEQVLPLSVPVVAVRIVGSAPLPGRAAVVRRLPRRPGSRPTARGLVGGLLVLGPVAPEVAGGGLLLRPAAGFLAIEVALVLLVLLVLVAEVGAGTAPVVAHLTCSRRHPSPRAWSPDSSTSGTGQPLNSAGRV